DHQAWGIATDANGNAYITGYFSSDITFGNITLTDTSNNRTLFLVKYDSSGDVVWATRVGGSSNVGNSVVTDVFSDVYLTGSYKDTIIFGNDTLLNSGQGDIFIAKYDSSGQVLWAR